MSAKREKPHWGARKILGVSCGACHMPSRLPLSLPFTPCSIAMGWSSPMGRRRSRAEGTPLSAGLHPNDLWCTDYKGEFQLSDKRYYPLSVTDYSSRYLLLGEALESTREELAFPAFERLFQEPPAPGHPLRQRCSLCLSAWPVSAF